MDQESWAGLHDKATFQQMLKVQRKPAPCSGEKGFPEEDCPAQRLPAAASLACDSLDMSVGGRSPGLCKQKPHLISGKRQPPFLWHDQTFLSPHKEEWLDSKSGKNKSVAAEENRKTFVDINRLLLKAILGPVGKPCKLTLSSSPSPLSLYNQTDI